MKKRILSFILVFATVLSLATIPQTTMAANSGSVEYYFANNLEGLQIPDGVNAEKIAKAVAIGLVKSPDAINSGGPASTAQIVACVARACGYDGIDNIDYDELDIKFSKAGYNKLQELWNAGEIKYLINSCKRTDWALGEFADFYPNMPLSDIANGGWEFTGDWEVFFHPDSEGTEHDFIKSQKSETLYNYILTYLLDSIGYNRDVQKHALQNDFETEFLNKVSDSVVLPTFSFPYIYKAFKVGLFDDTNCDTSNAREIKGEASSCDAVIMLLNAMNLPIYLSQQEKAIGKIDYNKHPDYTYEFCDGTGASGRYETLLTFQHKIYTAQGKVTNVSNGVATLTLNKSDNFRGKKVTSSSPQTITAYCDDVPVERMLGRNCEILIKTDEYGNDRIIYIASEEPPVNSVQLATPVVNVITDEINVGEVPKFTWNSVSNADYYTIWDWKRDIWYDYVTINSQGNIVDVNSGDPVELKPFTEAGVHSISVYARAYDNVTYKQSEPAGFNVTVKEKSSGSFSPTPQQGKNFSDVPETHKSAEAISIMADMGLLSGYEDGSFKPEGNITRAEFATVVCRALGVEANYSDNRQVFDDVPANHWAAGYITVAAQQGIVNGYGDYKFGPSDNIKYKDAVKMVVTMPGYAPIADVNGGYPDGYMITANQYGFLNGINGMSNDTLVTRAVVAQMIYNALNIPVLEQVGFGANTEFAFSDHTLRDRINYK